MAASIPPAQLAYYEQHATENQQPNLIATVVLCLALPCIAVFLRFLARRINHVGYKADDWLILLALVQSEYGGLKSRMIVLMMIQLPLAGMSTTTGLGISYGEGKHIIFLTNPAGFAKVRMSPYREVKIAI